MTVATASRARWSVIAAWLVIGTVAYNAIEAALAIWAGIRAGSVALVGFGLDSVIECVAAIAVLWRLRVERTRSTEELARGERTVHRIVGFTFVALALYVVVQSGWTLWTAQAPEESPVGIIVAIASLVIMPLVAWGKLRAAHHLQSGSLRAEAKETLACLYLSATLLLGLVATAAAGWWWADPVAALCMVPWLMKEGLEGIRDEDCDDSCPKESSEGH